MRRFVVVVAVVVFACSAVFANPDKICFPSTNYNSAIPTLQSALGYGLGEAFTPYASLERYYQNLAKASDRVRLEPYGNSVEGRTLYTVIISSPKNLGRLDAIRAAAVHLSDPRQLSEAEAQKLAAQAPDG